MKKWISLLSVMFFWSCATTDSSRIALDRGDGVQGKLKSSPCQSWKDSSGVTHLKSATELGGYACLGYVHGRDRAFHLDFLRRASEGRLGEILGKSKVPDDFFLRLLNLSGHALRVFEEMPLATQELLWAYSFGINKAFAELRGDRPYEFRELGYFPKEWRPEHSVAILLLQSFSETKISFTHEFTELEWIKAWGASTAALTSADDIPWDVTILKPGEYPERPQAAARPSAPTVPDVPAPLPAWAKNEETGKGSNSWVLAPSWSASGNAWFANDPHVTLQHPSFWYWTHLQAGEFRAMGATVPGLPVFPSGFNEHLAWGLTDSNMNVADVISVPEDDVADFESYRPTVWFKVGPLSVPYFFKTFRRSKEGYPVLPIEAPAGRAYVLRWTGFLVRGQALAKFADMGKVKSVEEMDRLLAVFALPSFNYVFADSQGGIGYRVTGLVPKETIPSAMGPTTTTWKEAVPFPLLKKQEMPHALQPPRGYLVTANNRWWGKGSAYYSGRQWANGFRGMRIEEEIKKTRAHDFDSLRRIQCDTQIVDARFFVPKLLKFADRRKLPQKTKDALDLLRKWNFDGDTNCVPCGLYQRWVEKIQEKAKLNLAGLYRLIDEPAEEKFEIVFFESLAEAVTDTKGLPWGDLHRAYFDHVSRAPEFASADWLPTAGNLHSVNVGGGGWSEGYYKHTSGAAQRLIVEMSSPPTAYFAHDGGNEDSEQRPISRHNSSWNRWARCEYQRAQFEVTWDKVPHQTITFAP